MDEKISITSCKEQFVPAEFTLLRQWHPIIELEAGKGTTSMYLLIQSYINREPGNPDRGLSWLSIRKLSKLCSCTINTVQKRIAWLRKMNFIAMKSGNRSRSNRYQILPLPPIPKVFNEVSVKDLVQAKDGLDDIRKEKNDKMIKALFGKKDIDKFNCNDLLKLFRLYYFKTFGSNYSGEFTGRARSNFKTMVETYGPAHCVQAVCYGIEHWDNFRMNGSDFPSAYSFFLKRNSIFTKVKRKGLRNLPYATYSEEEVGVHL